MNPAPVLAVVAWLISWTDGRRLSVTRREAQWITAVAEAVPSVPPEWAYDLARRYLRAESEGRSWAELDRALALQPWANEGRYRRAVEAGAAPRLLAPSLHTRLKASSGAPPAPEGDDDATPVSGRAARPRRSRPTGRTGSRRPTGPPKTEPPRPPRKLHLL